MPPLAGLDYIGEPFHEKSAVCGKKRLPILMGQVSSGPVQCLRIVDNLSSVSQGLEHLVIQSGYVYGSVC
jgi:hypothetical protein